MRIIFSLNSTKHGEWILCRQQNYEQPLDFTSNKCVCSNGVVQGDMFYLQMNQNLSLPTTSIQSTHSVNPSSSITKEFVFIFCCEFQFIIYIICIDYGLYNTTTYTQHYFNYL